MSQQTPQQSRTPTLLSTLCDHDRSTSSYLHHLDTLTLTILLYPFAAFFHPKLIWIAYLAVYWYSGGKVIIIAVYAFGSLICLCVIFVLKKLCKRPRPDLIRQVSKPHHFRQKERNNAMPSGDCIQSALFITYLHHLGVPLLPLLLFHAAVCVGRVYYMCHWIGDTVVATGLGVVVGWGVILFEGRAVLDVLHQYAL